MWRLNLAFSRRTFYDTAERPDIDQTSPYAAIVAAIDSRISAGVSGGADPADVARAIIAAVDDPTTPTCVLVGVDAIAGVKALRDAQFKTWSAERAAS